MAQIKVVYRTKYCLVNLFLYSSTLKSLSRPMCDSGSFLFNQPTMITIEYLRDMLDQIDKKSTFATYLVESGKIKDSEKRAFITGNHHLNRHSEEYSKRCQMVIDVFPYEFFINPNLLNESNINQYRDKLWHEE